MANEYLNRKDQMFPKLTAAQFARIAKVGVRREVKAGEVLFAPGEQNASFFVVVRGDVAISRPHGDREEVIVTHGPSEFTGEINMLSSRAKLALGRSVAGGEVIAVDRAHLHMLVQGDSELSEILMRAFILRRMALLVDGGDLILLGSRHSAATLQLKEFLTRNGQPFNYQDIETEPDVQTLLDRFQVGVNEVPVVLCQHGKVLRNPSIEKLAVALGLSGHLDPAVVRDVVIVGAGPAGLAGTSSRIENYLGFPTGISGQALAGRALTQAQKFGAEVAIARSAVRIECDDRPYKLHLESGDIVRTRAIVVATGARYRKMDLPALPRFEGNGVYYSATHLEGQLC